MSLILTFNSYSSDGLIGQLDATTLVIAVQNKTDSTRVSWPYNLNYYDPDPVTLIIMILTLTLTLTLA